VKKLGFTQLKKELIDKSENEAEKIIEEAKAKVLASEREAQAEEKALQIKADEDIKNLQDMLEKREIASASLEAKKMGLMAKKELVEKAFEKAVKEIDKRLNEKERKALIEKLLKKAEAEIKIAKVYCNSKDSKFIKGYPTTESKMLGGIIVEDKEGTVIVDYSFETMIEEIKESELTRITEIIFK
jgi:V/A-type H+/Na+-transporting ATPase subunit E